MHHTFIAPRKARSLFSSAVPGSEEVNWFLTGNLCTATQPVFSHWLQPTSELFWSNTRLCCRWSARPTGSWMQTIRWQLIPTLRSQLRQRWKWSTRPSMCHTPATPLLRVHLSLPLFPALPLYLSLSLSLTFCYAVKLWQPPTPTPQLSSCSCPSYLLSDCVGFWSLLLPVSMLSSQKGLFSKKEKPMQINFSLSWYSFSYLSPLTKATLAASEDVTVFCSSLTVIIKHSTRVFNHTSYDSCHADFFHCVVVAEVEITPDCPCGNLVTCTSCDCIIRLTSDLLLLFFSLERETWREKRQRLLHLLVLFSSCQS